MTLLKHSKGLEAGLDPRVFSFHDDFQDHRCLQSTSQDTIFPYLM